MGEPRKALVAFGDAVATDPGNPKCFYDRGHTYFDLGQLDEAEKDFESALRLDDSYADAWAELGTLRRVREQWKPALEAYDHALAARPDWTLALSNKAATLLELGKTDEALALCERIAEREDTPAESHWNQAVCLKEKGRAPDAVKAYRRYAALVPDDPDPYLECMALLGAMRKFDEALAAVKKAVRVAPDHPVVAFWHAESLVRAERARTGADESDPSAWRTQAFDEALAEYARARDLALRTAPAYWRPGALLLARGESEAALELLVEGCRENPEDYLCHHNRAAALELLGRWKDAIAAYTDAIRLSDRPLPSELSLAEIYVACEDAAARDPKKALLHARRAADLDPDRADVKIWLGAALFRTGEPERAHDALAGAGDPGNDKLRNVRELFLALVEHSLGRGDPASRLESASRWKGGLPSERRMLARLRAEVTAAIDR
jgi:tetratricopeptide (TPR) repeat protein